MFRKLFSLHIALIALLASDTQAYVQKKIPDHIQKRFPLIDPTIKHVPTHGYHPNQFDPPVYDPHVKKTEDDVPREPHNTIDMEDMHEDDHTGHKVHYKTAKIHHGVSIRKRDRMDKEEMARLTKKNQSIEHLEMDENPYKIAKPTSSPSNDEIHDMIISVFFRDKYRGDDEENDTKALEKWMHSNMMTIESELRDHNINFQHVDLPDKEIDKYDYVQILCNDPEERDHIKHLLIRLQPVLCFMMDGKIIYGKFPTEFEKEYWRGEREYMRKKKKQDEYEERKRNAKIKKMIDRGEYVRGQEPDHTDL